MTECRTAPGMNSLRLPFAQHTLYFHLGLIGTGKRNDQLHDPNPSWGVAGELSGIQDESRAPQDAIDEAIFAEAIHVGGNQRVRLLDRLILVEHESAPPMTGRREISSHSRRRARVMSWKTNDRCHDVGGSPPKRSDHTTTDCHFSHARFSRSFHFSIPRRIVSQDETVSAVISFMIVNGIASDEISSPQQPPNDRHRDQHQHRNDGASPDSIDALHVAASGVAS